MRDIHGLREFLDNGDENGVYELFEILVETKDDPVSVGNLTERLSQVRKERIPGTERRVDAVPVMRRLLYKMVSYLSE